ncbi:hypothetical protein PVAND_001923 [Polypedilum vanderplanki]|uniref:Uncharacterized protein n=1 Tax=Polypedilum vanderplanki TaxID=319348 RepID=A0A9J6BPU1_POLVA|nr:hypothetical protein PVAND_001923 [Polypedilum vanderplanki]
MNKTISPDSITVEEEFSESYDMDIAAGTSVIKKCEITNILSAQLQDLKSRVDGDKLYAIMDFLVPSLHGLAYGEAHIEPKLTNIGPLQNAKIPAKIDTKGKMKTTFTNIPLSFAFQFNIINRPDGKKSLEPEHMDGKLDCTNRYDDKYIFIPDPEYKSRIAKIFVELILNARSKEICDILMGKAEHKNYIENAFKTRAMKHFSRATFLDC